MASSPSLGTCSGQMNCLQVMAENPPGSKQRKMCKYWKHECAPKEKGKNTHPISFFPPLILLPLCSVLEGCWWKMETFINSLCRKANRDLHPLGLGGCSQLSLRNLPALPNGLWPEQIHLGGTISFSKASFRLLHKKNTALSRWRDFSPFKLLLLYFLLLI